MVHCPEKPANCWRHSSAVRSANAARSSPLAASTFCLIASASAKRSSVASAGRPMTAQTSGQYFAACRQVSARYFPSLVV